MKPIEISPKTIAILILVPIALYFTWLVRDLLFSLLIAFILMSALRPVVNILVQRSIPRTVCVFIVYASFLALIITLFSIIIPPLALEVSTLTKTMPIILSEAIQASNIAFLQSGQLEESLAQTFQIDDVYNVASGFLSNTFFVMSTLVFGFFFLLESNPILSLLKRILPIRKAEKYANIISRAEQRMAAWFWGEIALMTVVGLLSFIGFRIAGIPYAVPLALLAGILEIIPYLGPIVAGTIAALIALSQSVWLGLYAIIVAIIVQQLENSFIVPIIMRRAVGLNPIITLIVVIIGGKIGDGVLGILLSIPIYLIVETIIMAITKKETKTEMQPTQ